MDNNSKSSEAQIVTLTSDQMRALCNANMSRYADAGIMTGPFLLWESILVKVSRGDNWLTELTEREKAEIADAFHGGDYDEIVG